MKVHIPKCALRIVSFLAAVLVFCCFCVSLPGKAVVFTPNFEIHSSAGLMLNLDTNEVIFRKNSDTQYMPGTFVQIMEAIVVMENCPNLDMRINVDASLYENISDTQYPDDLRYCDIRNGDTFTVEELLYAIMLTSSCEAATLLANQFGNGSISNFVQMMNDKAAELGCTQTTFTNVTGLYDLRQKTTANDMAIIMKYALSFGKFETIATASSFTPYSPNPDRHDEGWTWAHSNLMVQENTEFYMEGVKGIKTANLTKQGRNIIAEASRDGNNFLVILMAAPFTDSEGNMHYYHMDDAEALFNWVFDHFSFKTILSDSTELGQISVKNGDGVDYVLVRPEKSYGTLWYDLADIASVTQELDLEENVSAPVKSGQKLGTVTLKFSGENIATLDLVATSSVELSKLRYYLALVQHFPKTGWLKSAIILSTLVCVAYVGLCLYSHIQYKNRKKEPVQLKLNSFETRREGRQAEQKEAKDRKKQSTKPQPRRKK